MSAPSVRKPADLPDLRLWLIEQWKPGRPFQMVAEVANRNQSYRAENGDMLSAAEPRWDLQVLNNATLWYVTREMCDVLDAAAQQLPENLELTHDMPIDPYGFVVFERPLIGTDANPNFERKEIKVDALAWGPGTVLPRGLEGMGIQTYQRLPLHLGLTPEELQRGTESGALMTVIDMMQRGQTTEVLFDDANPLEVWSWLGRSDWLFAHTLTHKIHDDVQEQRHESMVEDRRWLAALWFLSTQPNLSGFQEAEIPRQTRRRSERANVDSKVRIVNLRKPKFEKDAPAEHRTVEWSKRWLVGGHWRFQPYGPERKMRKWIWVNPYIKGPEDKPLVIRETVKVVK